MGVVSKVYSVSTKVPAQSLTTRWEVAMVSSAAFRRHEPAIV